MAENTTIKMFTIAKEAQARINTVFAAIQRIAADAEPLTPQYNRDTLCILRGLVNTADWLNRELDAVKSAPDRETMQYDADFPQEANEDGTPLPANGQL